MCAGWARLRVGFVLTVAFVCGRVCRLGALMVGFVLTMASAIPIFKVCKMYQCEHNSPPAVPRAT